MEATFTPLQRRGAQGYIRGELSADPRYAALLAQVDQLAAVIERGVLLKRDPDHAVLALTPAPDAARLLCKFFPQQGVVGDLQQRWRLDRPARMHRRLKQAAAADLPVPPSLGHVSVQGVGAAWFCPLVEGFSLLHWTGDHLPATRHERLALLMPAIDTMVKLHSKGFVHGDFKWGNVLWDAPGGVCWLVDVDGLRRAPLQGFCRSRGRDLARFLLDCEEAGVPIAEVQALLCRYADSAGLSVASVEARTHPVYRRLRQRHIRRYGEDYRLVLPRDQS